MPKPVTVAPADLVGISNLREQQGITTGPAFASSQGRPAAASGVIGATVAASTTLHSGVSALSKPGNMSALEQLEARPASARLAAPLLRWASTPSATEARRDGVSATDEMPAILAETSEAKRGASSLASTSCLACRVSQTTSSVPESQCSNFVAAKSCVANMLSGELSSSPSCLTAVVHAAGGGPAGALSPRRDRETDAAVQHFSQAESCDVPSSTAAPCAVADGREALAAFGTLCSSPDGAQMIWGGAGSLHSPRLGPAAQPPAPPPVSCDAEAGPHLDRVALVGNQGAGADPARQPPPPLPSCSPTGFHDQIDGADDDDERAHAGPVFGHERVQRPHSAPAGAAAAAKGLDEQPSRAATAAAHVSAGRALALQRLKHRALQRQAAALSSSTELAHRSWPLQPADAGSRGLHYAALVSAGAKTPLLAWLQVSIEAHCR